MKTCYCCMSKENLVTSWRAQNPAGSKNRCARELGIGIKTVRKWWDSGKPSQPSAEKAEIFNYSGTAKTAKEEIRPAIKAIKEIVTDYVNRISYLVNIEGDSCLAAMRQLLRAVLIMISNEDTAADDNYNFDSILDRAGYILYSDNIEIALREIKPMDTYLCKYAFEQYEKYKISEKILGDKVANLPDLCMLALERSKYRN